MKHTFIRVLSVIFLFCAIGYSVASALTKSPPPSHNWTEQLLYLAAGGANLLAALVFWIVILEILKRR